LSIYKFLHLQHHRMMKSETLKTLNMHACIHIYDRRFICWLLRMMKVQAMMHQTIVWVRTNQEQETGHMAWVRRKWGLLTDVCVQCQKWSSTALIFKPTKQKILRFWTFLVMSVFLKMVLPFLLMKLLSFSMHGILPFHFNLSPSINHAIRKKKMCFYTQYNYFSQPLFLRLLYSHWKYK